MAASSVSFEIDREVMVLTRSGVGVGSPGALSARHSRRSSGSVRHSIEAVQTDPLRALALLKEVIDRTSALKAYRKVSAKHLYKLFIDADRWERAEGEAQPHLVFDQREPGYILAMVHAFMQLMNRDKQRLTAEVVCRVHDFAIHGVKNARTGEEFREGYRSRADLAIERFGLVWKRTVTESGFTELLQKWSGNADDPTFPYRVDLGDGDMTNLFQAAMYNPYGTVREPQQTPHISLRYPHADAILPACVRRLLEVYYEQIRVAVTDEDRLRAIATLVQNLDQIHPFYDGNIRTFAILILNYLLVENRLSPCCFTDPNCVDCLSVDEIIAKIREGQRNFAGLLAQ